MNNSSLEPVVYLVDDDSAIRDSLSMLIRSVGIAIDSYATPKEFLENYQPHQIGCLLLDIRMPGTNGLSFQDELLKIDFDMPIIFITGHGDVNQCSRAFKAGAVDFLSKPIDEHALIDSMQKAISRHITSRAEKQHSMENMKRLEQLTTRECEVLKLIVEGLSNKEIARQFDLSLRTVESHRANIFEKLGVSSLVECVKIYLIAMRQTT